MASFARKGHQAYIRGRFLLPIMNFRLWCVLPSATSRIRYSSSRLLNSGGIATGLHTDLISLLISSSTTIYSGIYQTLLLLCLIGKKIAKKTATPIIGPRIAQLTLDGGGATGGAGAGAIGAGLTVKEPVSPLIATE